MTKTVEGVDDTFDWSFDFTISPTPEGQDATQAASGTGDGSDTVTWTALIPGEEYTISEGAVDGYTPGALACTGVEDTDGDDTDASVTFIAPLGGDGVEITCSITNTAIPSEVEIIKTVEGVADGFDWSFDFTISPTPDGQDATQSATGTGNSTDTVTWTDLVPGAEYTISETTVDGYDVGALVCTGVEDTDGDLTDESVTFVAPLGGEGVEISCELLNTAQTGELSILKVVSGVADGFAWGPFTFTLTPDDGTDPVQVQVDSDNPEGTFIDLVPGVTYTLEEVDVPAGYDAGDITCSVESADGGGGDIDLPYELQPGDVVSCDVTNVARPSQVTVTKEVAGVADGFDWSFDFTIDPATDGEDVTQTASGAGDGTAVVGWDNLVPGETYTITETTVDGYTAGELICEFDGEPFGDSDGVSVTFEAPLDIDDAAAEIVCGITNTAVPSEVEVTKTVEGVADGFAWDFEFTITPDAVPAGSQTADQDNPTVTWTDLVPGETYTIAEVAVDGFDAGVLVCEGLTDLDETDDEMVTFEAPLGGEGVEIICSITNVAPPSEVEVTKAVEGVSDDYEWSFDFTIDPATDGEDATMTASGTGDTSETVMWENLVPGETYTITETSVDGFTPGEMVCSGVEDSDDDPLSVTFEAPLDTEEGAEITCDITNTAVPGEVEVTKTVDGAKDDLDWSFEFTIDPAPAGQDATIAATGTGNGDAVVGWTDLVPGETYTIVEVDPGTSFVAGDLTCEVTHLDESVESVDPAAGISVEVGDSIDCAITNTARGDVLVDKTVTSLDEPGDGTFTVTYDLVVSSDSVLDEPYTLDDELLFGDGITIDSSSVSSADAAASASWNGIDDLVVTDGEQVLPVGETHTYTVTATGSVGATSTATSRDCVLDEGETGTGLLNEATVTYTIGTNSDDDCDEPENPAADLAVIKDGPATITLATGQTTAAVDYTLTVTNNGPGTAVDAMLVDTLPDGLNTIEATTPVGTCVVDVLVITCDLGDMAAGDEIVVEVSAMTTPFVDSSFTNVVEVTSSTPDPDTSNNRDEVTTTITTPELPRTGADLGLLGLIAALLLLAGLAVREVGVAGKPRT